MGFLKRLRRYLGINDPKEDEELTDAERNVQQLEALRAFEKEADKPDVEKRHERELEVLKSIDNQIKRSGRRQIVTTVFISVPITALTAALTISIQQSGEFTVHIAFLLALWVGASFIYAKWVIWN